MANVMERIMWGVKSLCVDERIPHASVVAMHHIVCGKSMHVLSRSASSTPMFSPIARQTVKPHDQPAHRPRDRPTNRPSNCPKHRPNDRPAGQPSRRPTNGPTVRPNNRPGSAGMRAFRTAATLNAEQMLPQVEHCKGGVGVGNTVHRKPLQQSKPTGRPTDRPNGRPTG